MILRRLSLLVSLPLFVSSCDDSEPSTPVERSAEVAPAVEGEAAQAVAIATVPAADWRGWVATEVTRIERDDKSRFDALMTLQPMPTRAATLRFRGELLRDASAAPVLLHRLTTVAEDAPVRAAIVDALSRTGVDVGSALADLLTRETDAGVREVIVETLWRASSDASLDGLRRGLADSEASVRAAAVRGVAKHARGTELATELTAALSDPDDATRLEAIQALGVHEVAAAKTSLVGLLADGDAEVRLATVRALGRIDATWAATLPEVTALAKDADPTVARAAAELTSR